MTFEMGALIAFVVAIIAGAVAYGRMQRSVESVSSDMSNSWKIIDDLRKWQSQHERDSANYRVELEKEMGKIRGDIGRVETKLDNILVRLSDIKIIVEDFREKNG